MRTRLLVVVAVFLAGCTSIHDEVCTPYDGRPESVRERVLGGWTLPASAQVIACQSRQAYSVGDDESCLISIDPADFEAAFPVARFGPDRPATELRPYATTPQSLAQAHAVTLDWLRGMTHSQFAVAIFSNHARDRVILYGPNDRCVAPAEIMSFSGTR